MYYNYLPNMGHCGLPSFIPQYHHLPCCEPSSTIVNINIPPCPGPEPEAEPLNLDSLTVGVDKDGEIRDASSGKLTGLKLKDCIDIISSAKHSLKIDGSGKLEGGCEEDKCKKCVDAINSGIVEQKKGDGEEQKKGDGEEQKKGGREDESQESASQEAMYFMDASMPIEDNIALIF